MTQVDVESIEGAPPPDDRPHDYDDDDRPIGWTTVATFFNSEDANVAAMQLDDQGIPCYIAGEMMTATAWHYALATGGAQVQVPQAFVERARAVLQPPAKVTTAESLDQTSRCPRCTSTDTRDARTGRRVAAAALLAAMMVAASPLAAVLGFFVGLWVLSTKRYRTCNECGFIWRASPARGFDVVTGGASSKQSE
jgi:hypothetical protein